MAFDPDVGNPYVRKGEYSAAEPKAAKMMQMIASDKYDAFSEFSYLLQAEVHVARGNGEAALKALERAPGIRNHCPRYRALLADTHRLLMRLKVQLRNIALFLMPFCCAITIYGATILIISMNAQK
jgi:hypothetical protein